MMVTVLKDYFVRSSNHNSIKGTSFWRRVTLGRHMATVITELALLATLGGGFVVGGFLVGRGLLRMTTRTLDRSSHFAGRLDSDFAHLL